MNAPPAHTIQSRQKQMFLTEAGPRERRESGEDKRKFEELVQ